MAFFERSDSRLFYEIDGDGRPLVFVNGLIMTASHWLPQLELAERYRVLRYDQRCQGRSSVAEHMRLGDFVTDLLALLDHLALDRVALCGISFGSIVAKEFARLHPERCDELVLVAPLRDIDPNLRCVYDVWRALLEAGALRAFAESVTMLSFDRPWPKLVAENHERSLDAYEKHAQPKQVLSILNSFSESDLASFNGIEARSLVIGARRDRIHNPEDATRIAEEIDGAGLIMMDSSHALTLDQAALFNETLREFLG